VGVSESSSNSRVNAVKSKSLDRFTVSALSVVISVPSELEGSTYVAVYVIVNAASLPSFVVKVNSSNLISSRSAPMTYEKSVMYAAVNVVSTFVISTMKSWVSVTVG